ncbi:Fibrobacter succinogenes major paralogous domain [Candidatus Ornithobacterium hominis]|uniref:FISUMP domain-containing protein n=1 Tax=Candidatus Ornithobacterium hominis TaxID=2497989 RepID=UPI0024BD4FEF|nr:FISUMP domain-containing protein [Candidatus Ornithobacterium hominis]CAI9428878.1 Fibrobacter succinogenes major paralogous domain [Candidatus Ornithobacterium hominis]
MKKLLLSFVVLPGALATAQVGINTEEPKAMLDISAKDNQKGDLRIQDVEEKSTQWLLVWDEEDQKVKRRSLSDLKYDMILDKGKINYIRSKQPDRADEIINKIKKCAPENILFDKLFGIDYIEGKHDFVYCATLVSEGSYNRTWLNLNLGAAYADINSPHFNPTVNKTGEATHGDDRTYGSLYQWQRASDGHEFRDSQTTTEPAPSWTWAYARYHDHLPGKFITGEPNWVRNTREAPDLKLWGAVGVNDPCPSGYHVPTEQEWDKFHQAVTGSHYEFFTNQMWTQTKLPNLAAAGKRGDDGLIEIDEKDPYGYYWSNNNTIDLKRVNSFIFNNEESSIVTNSYHLAEGHSVRCIKNN